MPQDVYPRIFGPQDDNTVPGELLVKLTDAAQMSVTASIPPGPVRRAAVPAVNAFGVAELDQALQTFGVRSIVKVHGPVPPGPSGIRSGVLDTIPLEATYRVQFQDAAADLDRAVDQLNRLNQVEDVSRNYFRSVYLQRSVSTPTDPGFTRQWGLKKINCPQAWQKTTGSPNVIVAVIDTGIDLDHPDLRDNLIAGIDVVDWAGQNPPPGYRLEGDFLTYDDIPDDEVGHGTHVAGIIAAVMDNAIGVAGVAPSCRLMPVRVMARIMRLADGYVTGTGTSVDIATGIRWAVDHGAHVLNLSLGGYNRTFVEEDAVAYAITQGALVIAAMGNDNINVPSYPAAYTGVLAVGATDRKDQRASFPNWGSNYGPHIGLVAPGVEIYSTYWDNIYSNLSGTSMATPYVAGVAALLKSRNRALNAAQIAQILRQTATPLQDNPADPVPNDFYGFGLVNAEQALAQLDGAAPAQPARAATYA